MFEHENTHESSSSEHECQSKAHTNHPEHLTASTTDLHNACVDGVCLFLFLVKKIHEEHKTEAATVYLKTCLTAQEFHSHS